MESLNDSLINEIIKITGKDNVIINTEGEIPYENDASYIRGEKPFLVTLPKDKYGISKALKLCNENKINVTVRSGGTSLTGSSVMKYPGILINTMNLDKIIELNLSSRYVVCEPGVRLDVLNNYLKKYGFFYPPDPASSRSSTVGGTLSTNAGGLRAVKYGATKEWVLGLELVLADGEIISTGEYTLKRSAGYDLTALLIGSEGTLGIITKAILKIETLPEKTGKIIGFFKNIYDVGNAMSSVKNNGITPIMAEFMDFYTLNSIKDKLKLKIPDYTKYMLMLDIDSTSESLDKKLLYVKKLLSKFSDDIITIKDQKIMDEIYMARKGAYSSLLKERENKDQIIVIGDIIVPADQLPDAMKEIEEKVRENKLKVTLFGHIGDGNIHANIFADNNETGLKKVYKFQMDIAKVAIKHRGSVSAEHGIGLEKNELLYEEYKDRNSLYTLELMKNIKKVFDPNNIMNRGKIFYESN